MPVVGDRDHTGLRERADRRQFFARKSFRDRAGRQDIHARAFRRAIFDPGDRARTIRDRRCIRHADDGGEATRRRGARTGFNRLLPAEARFAQMHVDVDQAGGDDEIARVNDLGLAFDQIARAR